MSYIDTNIVNQYGYQPNFILVNSPSKESFFGDIIPIYRATQELTSVLVTSWEGLSNFILNGRNFLICVLSFLSQAINNTAYQSFLVINFAYQQVLELPSLLGGFTKQVEAVYATIAQESTRELWWLEVKLDTRTLLDKVIKYVENIWVILQKFYLAAFVLLCLAFLNLSTPMLASTNSNSFLAKFLNNNSYISQSAIATGSNFKVTTNLNTTSNAVVVSTISAYTVRDGDTLDKISESFGVKSSTICFNNYSTTENCIIKIGDKLYIPWVDGYIYNAATEISATDLASLYGIEKQDLTDFNSYSYNSVSDSFGKDTLVLIPTSDFTKVSEANKKEQERKDAVAKSAEQAARTRSLISKSIPRSNALPNLNYMKGGFIWPTVGVISRCVQPGHIACDIANFSSPAVVASKNGIVTKVGFEGGGYGNHIIIDHGTDENGRSIRTLYAHLASVSVSRGESVTQGQEIGVMGRTGYSTGIHLHYECIINGVKQNPLEVCLP